MFSSNNFTKLSDVFMDSRYNIEHTYEYYNTISNFIFRISSTITKSGNAS